MIPAIRSVHKTAERIQTEDAEERFEEAMKRIANAKRTKNQQSTRT